MLFGAAYQGWGFQSTRLVDGLLQVDSHPQPPTWAPDAEKDAAYAGTVTGEMALDFIRTHRDDEAPYFLEVAPYAPHSRTSPTPAYPGDPLFPPAFGDRPGHGTQVRRLRAGPLRPARPRPSCPGTATTSPTTPRVRADGSRSRRSGDRT